MALNLPFGNNGNVFISGASFPNTDFFAPSGEVVNIDVLDNGDIIFGFTFTGFTDNPADGPVQSVAVGRLLPDGVVDQGFGDNGFFVRTLGSQTIDPLFQLTPDDGVVIAFTSDLEVPSLLVLNPGGDLIAETLLTPNSEIANAGSTTPNTSVISASDLAIDQNGNIVVRSSRSFGFVERPSIIQVALPSANDIVFDLNNRLVVGGEDLLRFELS